MARSQPSAFALWVGDPQRHWQSHDRQAPGMSFELALKAAAALDRVTLDYWGHDARTLPAGIRVWVHGAEGWTKVLGGEARQPDPFLLVNGHPTYDLNHLTQTVRFEPVSADAIRVEITDPSPHSEWGIGDVELYRLPPS